MAHGIYKTKKEAKFALGRIKKRTGGKPRLKIEPRYIIVNAK